MDEPVVFTLFYGTVVRLSEACGRMPKVHRPTLVRRILDHALDLLGVLTELRYARERQGLFQRADRHLDHLRVLVRLAADLRALSRGQYAALAEELSAVGRMVGGWRRSG